jgi:N-methylhydantoinase B
MPFTWMPSSGQGRILVDNSLTGGCGARADGDGLNSVDNSVTNAMNYPVEVMEQEHPVVVQRHEQRRASGGAGKFRGGLGLRREVRLLKPGILSVRGYRHRTGPPGLLGGQPGQPTRFWIERDGQEIPIAPQASGIPTQAGDVFVAETPGGGGLGAPAERMRAAVIADVQLGAESVESALSRYGIDVRQSRN